MQEIHQRVGAERAKQKHGSVLQTRSSGPESEEEYKRDLLFQEETVTQGTNACDERFEGNQFLHGHGQTVSSGSPRIGHSREIQGHCDAETQRLEIYGTHRFRVLQNEELGRRFYASSVWYL